MIQWQLLKFKWGYLRKDVASVVMLKDVYFRVVEEDTYAYVNN